MALIRFAEGQQRSGAIGGSVYSHNRFGAYIRARSVPVNPNTDLQVAVRNAVRSLSIGWQNNLDQVGRNSWNIYAANVSWVNALGDSVKLTGINQYIRSNTNLLINGFTRVDRAPVIFNLADAESALSVSASEATQVLTVTFEDSKPWVSEDGGHQFISMGIPQNSGIKFFGGPWREAFTIDGEVLLPPTSPATGAASFLFAEGQRLWIRTRIIRADGRLSEFAQVNFLAAA